jgi:hypothetical protein
MGSALGFGADLNFAPVVRGYLLNTAPYTEKTGTGLLVVAVQRMGPFCKKGFEINQ